MSRECFLCGEEITGKISKEHIFSNSFLSLLNLKTQSFTFRKSTEKIEYSRLKVPSHSTCNNEFGSRFEEYILKLISSFNSNYDTLRKLHVEREDSIVASIKETLTQWLAKIYIGFVYWEAHYNRHSDPDYQCWLLDQVGDPLVNQLQRCFKNEWYFNVPSSLYYFRIPEQSPEGFEFDFATGLPLGLIYLKFNEHLLVACIADGYLVEEYFTENQYNASEKVIMNCSSEDPAAYLHPVSHIWSVRENLPIKPKIEYIDTNVVDKSRENPEPRPSLDIDLVNKRAKEIQIEHASKFKPRNA